jgi:gliding motility-associated lipoprotein GldH
MRNFLFFLIIVSLFSCDNIPYENYHSFNEGVWDADSAVSFDYTVSDTLISYDLSLSVRHSVDYEYQNLFLFVESDTKDTVEIMLADKSGKWNGSGISDIRELNYTFQTSKIFDKKGVYNITFEQAMRYGSEEKIQHLENITDIGLIILKHND